jgi:hypothetical protein
MSRDTIKREVAFALVTGSFLVPWMPEMARAFTIKCH